MKRDILNYLNVKIGELELPEGTSEEVWEQKLAVYAEPPQFEVFPDVSAAQFRQAAFLMGVGADAMLAIIETLDEPDKNLALIEWEYQTVFKRDSKLINRITDALGVVSADVDSLWRLAATL